MPRLTSAAIAIGIAVNVFALPARAGTDQWLVPPVDGVITRRFEQPEMTWGPGHRGIDYAVAPGTKVRAAGTGRVVFAGRAGRTIAVTVDHAGGMSTTYTDLAEVLVVAGQIVQAGTWIGIAGSAHPGVDGGLHFGVKLEGAYVDPELYLGPVDTGRAITLAPLTWASPPALDVLFNVPGGLSAHHDVSCGSPFPSSGPTVPPNDNLAVIVPGIGSVSRSGSSAALRRFALQAGFRPDAVFDFSYRGTDGLAFHDPYSSPDTFGSIEVSAGLLEDLLRALARAYPERDVDLIAHSQGGIVARTYLQRTAGSWRSGLPRVEHLVTLSSPHSGAPLAGAGPELSRGRFTGAALRLASEWAQRGGPLPDPFSPAVADLAPGSGLMQLLAQEDLTFGVRGLSLAIPNDIVVPADRAELHDETHRVVPPAGIDGHNAVLASDEAVAHAARFLRDAREACPGGLERWGRLAGRSISWAEGKLPRVVGALSRLWPLPW